MRMQKSNCLPEQASHQSITCLPLALFQHMRVLPQHKARIGVSDKFLHCSWILACIQHIGDDRMAEIMQTHPFETDFLCRIVEVMRTKIRRQHLTHIIDAQIRNIDAKLLM